MSQKIRICLADDDEDDKFFVRDAFENLVPSTEIVEACDGIELIDDLGTILLL